MTKSLEELKQQAQDAKQRKKDLEKYEVDLRSDDMLFVLHKEEVDTLENVLLSALSGGKADLSIGDKKNLLSVLKYLQS